jgi:hypothetical protein
MNIEVKVTGLDRLLARWQYIARTGLRKEMRALAEGFAPLLLEAVRSNAPVQTGGYRSRLTATVQGYSLAVTSPDPFAARLEYGFIGTDSLGRHYAQPPHPHFRPAADTVGPQYIRALMAIVKGMAS